MSPNRLQARGIDAYRATWKLYFELGRIAVL